MIREVVFRPAAKADLREIYDYIERHSPESAARYVERIDLEDRVEIAAIAYGGRDLIKALREGEF